MLPEDKIGRETIEGARKSVIDSVGRARQELDVLDSAREGLIRLSREVIRSSGRAITAIHKGDIEEALSYMEKCEEYTRKLLEEAKKHPQLLHTGLVNNAVSEYVEAKLFISLVLGGKLPSFEELETSVGVPLVPYLQGLGDLVGELKRLALEYVRGDKYDKAWLLLDLAESIYMELQSLDYPDALLPGVRRKADVARKIVDDLKSMLVDLSKREELARLLEENLRRSRESTI